MDITIRDARPSDLEFIVSSNARMALETEGQVLDETLLRPGVAAVLADPGKGRYFIAEARDGATARPVGQMMLTYEWSDWRNGVFWWIQSVYVVAELRGAGVFGQLYRHVDAAARADAGVCGLRLYVDHGNTRAQAIYAHLGMHSCDYAMMESVFRGPANPSHG